MNCYIKYKFIKMMLSENDIFNILPNDIRNEIIMIYLKLPRWDININKYNGLSWLIEIDITNWCSFTKFIEKLKNTPYKYICRTEPNIKKPDLNDLDILLTEEAKIYFNLIKEAKNPIDIIDINSYHRLIIYLICKIFKLQFETIKENHEVIIPCTDFATDDSYTKCGCDNAPRWFHDNHYNNSYDDDIAYSKVWRTKKIGVKIFK